MLGLVGLPPPPLLLLLLVREEIEQRRALSPLGDGGRCLPGVVLLMDAHVCGFVFVVGRESVCVSMCARITRYIDPRVFERACAQVQ